MTPGLPLLGHDEPAAFEVIRTAGRSKLVLVCDHASNRVPARLRDLGLTGLQLASHIGWDSGAAAVSRRLSRRLAAPLVLSSYSRLVIDCNRWPTATDSIPASSDGIAIPGNAAISAEERLNRRLALFDPYQAEVATQLGNAAPHCTLLSIHSFTPSLCGVHRPWPIGVCYRNDGAQAGRLLAALQVGFGEAFPGRIGEPIGDNEPYAVEADCDYTIPVQGESRGISSVMLELRQDEIQDHAGVEVWSDIIVGAWSSIQAP